MNLKKPTMCNVSVMVGYKLQIPRNDTGDMEFL